MNLTTKYRLTKIEKLIVASMVILPYTLLRFGIMGFGELFYILLFLYVIHKRSAKDWFSSYHFSRFWIIYLIVSFLGFIYNVFFLSHATGTVLAMVFDFGAFIVVLMSSYSLESIIRKNKINPFAILKNIFIFSSLVMSLLFLLSFFTSSLFGISLKYYHYFVPLANNLHQISMFLVPLPFIGLKVFAIEKKKVIKFIIFIFILLDAYMAFQTGSAKAYLSIYFGLFFFLTLYIFYAFSKGSRFLLLFLVFSITGIITLYNTTIILQYSKDYFVDQDLQSGRQILYSNALEVGFSSPVIGLGTGAHIWQTDKYWDVHQSFLAAFLHAGLIGVFLLINIFYKTLKRNINEPALFAAVIAILMYALGGDVLRRLPIWIFLILIFYYRDSKKFYSDPNQIQK